MLLLVRFPHSPPLQSNNDKIDANWIAKFAVFQGSKTDFTITRTST